MDKRIQEFIQNTSQKTLQLEHTSGAHILYEWTNIQNPLRVLWNITIIGMCKYLPFSFLCVLLHSLIGINIGKNVGISPNINFDIFHPELITIGDNALIGWKVHILCHEFMLDYIRIGRVIIGENVTIGALTTIRSGTTIGQNSIVAMHSFVNKDIPANQVWGGVPAKKIRDVKPTPTGRLATRLDGERG